jgi:glycosyltransferase involved in cell wall biosynthesis
MTASAAARATTTLPEPRLETKRKRVALYYPWIYLTSGAERTILELTARSRHEWTLFTNRFEPDATFPGFGNRRVVTLGNVTVKRSIAAVARAACRIAAQRLPVGDFDVLVVVCEGLGDLVMVRTPLRPALCICLTPLRAAFDTEYRRRVTGRHGLVARAALAAALALFRAIDRRVWKRYSRVFCISEESRRRAVEGGLAPSGSIEVLRVGAGIRGEAPSDLFRPFFFVPGRIMWTKNLELAIAGFDRFQRARAAHPPFRLVIAGIVDRKSESYLARLRDAASHITGVEFRVAPSDDELRELYRTCYAVLFPSFNEDWGIVPVEAMSFGKPVIATGRGGPCEVIRHGVDGFLEEPQPEAFAARMIELARSCARTRGLGLAAFRRSRDFSWESFTARIDQAIEEGAL